MLISQTRIRKVDTHLDYINEGNSFIIALNNIEEHRDQLLRIGFDDEFNPGDQLLPKAIGSISEFNAYGKYIKHTDQPKETIYHQQEWTWKDWGGHEHSKIVDVPYERYPRDFIEPPSEEIKIIIKDSSKLIISDELVKKEEQYNRIKHTINLFLEIFGECIILDENYEQLDIPEIKRKNWQFLPPGEYPWEQAKDHLEENIKKVPPAKQPVIKHRLQTITQYTPTQIVLGKAGFDGYMVFCWEDKDLYILEHPNYGNATYVFREDWKRYSNLTKREIISDDLHDKRLIHREGWPEEIANLLN